MKTTKKDTNINIRLKSDFKNRLELLAQQEGLTLAHYIRWTLGKDIKPIKILVYPEMFDILYFIKVGFQNYLKEQDEKSLNDLKKLVDKYDRRDKIYSNL